jgi:hypothetical protein
MKKFFVVFLLALTLGLPAQGQTQRPGGPIVNALFDEGVPPPGAVTVLGRSFVGSLQNGFGNSLVLLFGSDDNNIRQELGITDEEANSLRALKAQILLNTPKYAARFKSMSEADHKMIQEDLEQEMSMITASIDKALSPERKEKTQKFVFQTLGGLDSPIINLNAMETLKLSEDQKKKMQSVFDEMKEERQSQMEEGLKLVEKAIALGGPLMPAEDQKKLNEERKDLDARIYGTGKKLGERLRLHLTLEQLEQEKMLIASRPSFLPKLPQQMRTAEKESYAPGSNSWRPGQDVPIQKDEPKYKQFPRTEQAE